METYKNPFLISYGCYHSKSAILSKVWEIEINLWIYGIYWSQFYSLRIAVTTMVQLSLRLFWPSFYTFSSVPLSTPDNSLAIHISSSCRLVLLYQVILMFPFLIFQLILISDSYLLRYLVDWPVLIYTTIY